MRSASGLAFGGFGLAVTFASFLVTLEVTPTPAAPGITPAAVNRTLKGDRLLAIPGARSVLPAPRAPDPNLPDGCVAAFKFNADIYASEVPGRCVV